MNFSKEVRNYDSKRTSYDGKRNEKIRQKI